MTRILSIAVASTAVVFGSARLALSAGECADDPDLCFAPRSWIEDFEQNPFVVSPDDWQRRNGTSPMPSFVNGQAIFDGTQNAWTLIDSADHYFAGTTTVNIVMDENPGGPGDRGAGWWINMDNEGIQGGFFPIFGVLTRNGDGEQVYQFGQSSTTSIEEITIAEGPVSANIFLLPPEDGEGDMGLAYTITDSTDAIFDGFFDVPALSGANVATDDKWLTLFSMADGQGIIDYIEVHNQPQDEPSLVCDLDGNAICDVVDIDQLVGGIIAGSNDGAFDVNGDGSVDTGDLDEWRSVAATENGFAAAYLPADSDLNGIVDAGDLNNLALNWNGAPNTWSGGDFDASGIVNAGDLNAIGVNWQQSIPLAAQAVPEPGTGMLLLLAFAALAFRRKR